MRRRKFIALLGGAAAWPLAARAQQPTLPVIGFLHPATAELSGRAVSAFRQGLGEMGYVEGRDVALEFRWADGHNDRLQGLAADLVDHRVALIFTTGTPAAQAAKAATPSIPIVFSLAGNPVDLGLVASLNRPGGNLTGITSLNVELEPKRLELLHEMAPSATSFAVLVNPTNPTATAAWRDLQTAALRLGLQAHLLRASNEGEIEAAFASLTQLRPSALVIDPDPFFNARAQQLAALATRLAIPASYSLRGFAAAGGLMSYEGSQTDQLRLACVYIVKILKGEKPPDLPVQQATKVELTINLKTARAFGISVPLALLARADEVIE
jgi:putative ABC transport system substrate-binding protein